MTYRYVVYDLQKSFNASFDDADFTFNQILYWVLVVANKLRVQQTALTNTDLFTSTFSSVAVQEDANGRKYIELPSQIMDLPYNEGIVYITYNLETCKCEGPTFAQAHFNATSIGAVKTLYMDEYTKPTPENPFFYRVGQQVDGVSVNRVYLLGVECVPVEDVEIAIKTTLNPKDICSLDDKIPLPDELIQDLIMQVLQLGKYIMMMPKENTNEGEDDSAPDTRMYANRAVNLPETQTQQQ